MGYEIVGVPFLLMETVAMLHKFVNGIPFQSAISRQRFFMNDPAYAAKSEKLSRLQAIMEQLCAGKQSFSGMQSATGTIPSVRPVWRPLSPPSPVTPSWPR